MKNNILLIKFSAIGDVIAFTPVIGYLSSSNKYDIHHWVMNDCKAITEYNPAIKKQFIFNYKGKYNFKTLFSLIKNLYYIMNERYEYIFLFHRSSVIKILTIFIRSKYRYGYKKNNLIDFLYTKNLEFDIFKNRSMQDIDLLRLSDLIFPKDVIHNLKFFLPENYHKIYSFPFKRYIIVNTGGGNLISDARNRLWPIEKYLSLINLLTNNIILLGKGESDAQRANFIIKNTTNRNIINLVNKTSFYETAEIIKNAQLYIGNDSGLIFLSTALNVLNVGIYGPTPVSSAVPIGNKTFFVKSNFHCSPCYNPKDGTTGKMYLCQENLCMQNISVDEVLCAVNIQLKLNDE